MEAVTEVPSRVAKRKNRLVNSGSHRNENAPARDRAKVQKVVDRASDIRGDKIPAREEGDSPPEGETAVYNDHNRRGDPRTNILMGRMGGKPTEHSYIKYGTEKAFPRSREAEYRLKSSEEHGKTRYRVGGTLHDTIAPKDTVGDGTVPQGAMKEEKPRFAKFEDKPANYEEVGTPGITAAWAPKSESSTMDVQLMKKAKEQGANDPDNRRVYTVRANLDKEMRDSYDPKKTLWVKGPDTTKIGGNPPEREMHPTQESGFLQQKRRTFDSSVSGRSGRSDSPRSAGLRSSNHRRRSPDWTVRRAHKDSRDRRHSKRDATDQASQAQANAETSQPGTTAAVDFKQEYQGYLEAFDMVRSNATDIVMPIVEEMVEDSDSALVWGMAWEIISLADPSIIVAGGLFYQGMHACDWYEDYMANTTDAEGMEALRGVNYILIDIYQAAWAEANEALEQADLLGPLEKLASALDTNDTSVAGLEADHTTTDRIIEFFDGLPDSNLTAGFEGNVTSLPVNTTSLTMGNSTFPSTENSTSAAGSTTAIPTDTASSLPIGNLTKPVDEPAAGMGNKTEPGNDATASSTTLATTSPSEVVNTQGLVPDNAS